MKLAINHKGYKLYSYDHGDYIKIIEVATALKNGENIIVSDQTTKADRTVEILLRVLNKYHNFLFSNEEIIKILLRHIKINDSII